MFSNCGIAQPRLLLDCRAGRVAPPCLGLGSETAATLFPLPAPGAGAATTESSFSLQVAAGDFNTNIVANAHTSSLQRTNAVASTYPSQSVPESSLHKALDENEAVIEDGAQGLSQTQLR